jgi:hypothetical protein
LGCGRNPHGCTRRPKRYEFELEHGQPISKAAKPLQDSRLWVPSSNRLGAGHLLTTRSSEFTCLEFGSPSETLLGNEFGELGFETRITVAKQVRITLVEALASNNRSTATGCGIAIKTNRPTPQSPIPKADQPELGELC